MCRFGSQTPIVEASYKIHSCIYFEENPPCFFGMSLYIKLYVQCKKQIGSNKNINAPMHPIESLFSCKIKNLWRRLAQIQIEKLQYIGVIVLIIRNFLLHQYWPSNAQIHTCIKYNFCSKFSHHNKMTSKPATKDFNIVTDFFVVLKDQWIFNTNFYNTSLVAQHFLTVLAQKCLAFQFFYLTVHIYHQGNFFVVTMTNKVATKNEDDSGFIRNHATGAWAIP